MPACFIVNPVSGNGAASRAVPRIRGAAPRDAVIVTTTRPRHATELARRAAVDGYDPIVAVGGDGTVMEVVQGVMDHDTRPRLGIIPIGNGNDFARMLRLSRDPAEATRRLWQEPERAIDVATCNGRFFLNVGGAGLDTVVAGVMSGSAPGALRNPAGYLLYGIRELMRFRNPEFRITLDDETVVSHSLLIAVANGRYFAGGMKVCPDASPVDGWFDVCVAGDLGKLETLTLIPRIYLGRHLGHPKVTIRRARRVEISAPAGEAIQLDGEVVERVPAVFEMVPNGITIVGVRDSTLFSRG